MNQTEFLSSYFDEFIYSDDAGTSHYREWFFRAAKLNNLSKIPAHHDKASVLRKYKSGYMANLLTVTEAVHRRYFSTSRKNNSLVCFAIDIDRLLTLSLLDKLPCTAVVDRQASSTHLIFVFDKFHDWETVQLPIKLLARNLSKNKDQTMFTLVKSPLLDKRNDKELTTEWARDNKKRDDFHYVRPKQVTISLSDLWQLVRDTELKCLDKIFVEQEEERKVRVTKKKASKKKGKATKKETDYDGHVACLKPQYDPIAYATRGRNCALFVELQEWCKDMRPMATWSYEAVEREAIEISKHLKNEHGSETLSEVKSTAKSVFGYFDNNYDASKAKAPYDVKVRWMIKRLSHECLVEFANREGVSHDTARQWKHRGKLVSLDGKWYSKNDITVDIIQHFEREREFEYRITCSTPSSFDISSCITSNEQTVGLPLSDIYRDAHEEDREWFKDVNETTLKIFEPPIPPPRDIKSYSTRELTVLWDC